jgi:hypothetical protein
MPVLEMQARLPLDESTFCAESADACRDMLSSVQSSPRLSLVYVIQRLMAIDPISPELLRLTALPMFLIIGGRISRSAAKAYQLTCNDSIASHDFHSEDTIA